jgi:hypothetical protein
LELELEQEPMNRRMLLSIGLLVLVGLLSCNVDVIERAESGELFIPAGNVLAKLDLATEVGDLGNTELIQSIENRGLEDHHVDSFYITRVILEIVTDPEKDPSFQQQDLYFLKGVEIFLEAPGQPKIMAATGGPYGMNQKTAELMVTDQDLKYYITAPSMKITARLTGSQPDKDIRVRVTVSFLLDANIAGVACGG